MKFTFEGYRGLITLLKQNGYNICGYDNYSDNEKTAILRHDIDFSVEKALELASIEQEEGVSATYFVLLSTDFYNVNSRKTTEGLRTLINQGGVVGLHFDEMKYDLTSVEQMIKMIQKEQKILSLSLDTPINVVSMHRPSKLVLSQNIEIPDMINSYGEEFIKGFKYVSDSRMNWREDVEQIIKSGKHNKLHILTHAFWYQEKEMETKDILGKFVSDAKNERYISISENIKNVEDFLHKEDI